MIRLAEFENAPRILTASDFGCLSRQELRLQGSTEADATNDNAYQPVGATSMVDHYNHLRSHHYYATFLGFALNSRNLELVLPSNRLLVLGQDRSRPIFGLSRIDDEGKTSRDPWVIGVEVASYSQPPEIHVYRFDDNTSKLLTDLFYSDLIAQAKNSQDPKQADAFSYYFLRRPSK